MAVMEAILSINSPIIRQAGIALEMTAVRILEIKPLMIIATQQEIVIILTAIKIATTQIATATTQIATTAIILTAATLM